MKKYTVAIEPDVLAILERSTITPTSVTLPSGQLARELYERVDKVLKAAGGKWDRRSKTHLFARDPREALGLALVNGAIVDQRKAWQQFFTPPVLAATLAHRACIGPGDRVLEPSAGEGALAIAARGRGAHVTCVEIDQHLCAGLLQQGFNVIHADFLHIEPYQQSDVVLMNPPFANGQDIAHVRHAFNFLRAGRLLSVLPSGVTTNSTRAYVDFRDFVQQYRGTFKDLPEGSFEDAGTLVRTVLLEMWP